MSRRVVFVPEPIAPAGMDLLGTHCDIIAPWQTGQSAGEIPAEADAALVRIYRVDAERVAAAPNLRVVAKHGVGLDNIDIPAASARQVAVLWTPEANAEGVAQHAIALMLALTNRVKEADAGVRAGRFGERMAWGSVEVSERTLGIVGLGRIGRRSARKAALGLGMNVLAYDPYVDRSTYDGPAVFVDALDELLSRADVVTLHVPLTDETRHIINADSLAHMRAESYLVNTARGAAVDEEALAEALSAGRCGHRRICPRAARSSAPSAERPQCAADAARSRAVRPRASPRGDGSCSGDSRCAAGPTSAQSGKSGSASPPIGATTRLNRYPVTEAFTRWNTDH